MGQRLFERFISSHYYDIIAREKAYGFYSGKGNFVMKKVIVSSICIALMACSSAYAARVVIPMYLVSAQGITKSIGHVTFEDTRFGMLITPQLIDLPPGLHGFHVHENATCANFAMAAGGAF